MMLVFYGDNKCVTSVFNISGTQLIIPERAENNSTGPGQGCVPPLYIWQE